MALISCPECNNQVSNTAAACPQCGAPIAEAMGSKAAGVPLTTVQETSKKLKLHIIIASILFWVGVVWLFVGINAAEQGGEQSEQFVISILLLFVGLVWYVVTRFRIWWHHK